MSQDITPMQILCAGSVLGTAAPATPDKAFGCTYTRLGAGSYAIVFAAIPPGPLVPSINDVIVDVTLLAADSSTIVCTVTKTVDGSGNCTGFTVATGAPTDESFNWIVYRAPQG